MPPPKADAARELALKLARTLGVRGVAERLKAAGHVVGKSTVAEWVKAARAGGKGSGKPARPASAPRPPPEAAPAPRKRPAEPPGPELAGELAGVGPEAAGARLPELVDTDLEGLDFRELVKLDRQVMKFLGEAFKAREERRFIPLGRFKLEVRAAMAKLRPPPKVDPAADPANLEARAAVLERVRKMIRNAQGVAAGRVTPAPPPSP